MSLANNLAKNNDSAASIMQFLTFTIDNEEYGVDIMTVREIKGWSETTHLPNSPEYMLGVMNLRGAIIPIFDLRVRFGQNATQANSKHVFVILAAGERTVGILVDAVSDILNSNADAIQEVPVDNAMVSNQFISGLISNQDRMVVLLNVEKLFDAKEYQHLEEQQTQTEVKS